VTRQVSGDQPADKPSRTKDDHVEIALLGHDGAA
jgi:hypothetical protein